jgi:pimeloyl-ACP methyl ester carboxylesterase
MTQPHTIHLNDVQLHYAEAAGPGPALVIVHGLTGSHDTYLPFMPILAQHAHVYALDLRGHNLSGHTPGAYQVPDYGRDVVAFIETVVGEPAFVVGHSLGGLIAVWLAAQATEWVCGIFLEDPPLYIAQLPRFQETGFYDYFVMLRDHLPQHHAGGGTLDDLIAYVGQSPADETQTMLEAVGLDAVRQRAVQLHRLDPAIFAPALAGAILAQHQPDDLLAQVRCPVHLLAAQLESGGAMGAQDVQRAVSMMPHCTHTVFEGGGHMIHQERSEAWVQALVKFVTE